MTKTIDLDLARKLLSVVDAGLVSGLGKAKPGEMCVEAAVCYALGEKHGDSPACVAEHDRQFKIKLNDSPWSSPEARAKGLRRLSVMQLGTAGTDRGVWCKILVELAIRRIVPEALEAAAKLNPKHADALHVAAEKCRAEGSEEAAREARSAAYDAYAVAYDAAYAAANAAAYAAYDASAYAAANAAYAAYDAAASAAYAANYAAYAYAAANAAYAAYDAANAASAAAAYAAYAAAAERDRILTISARCAEEAYERTGSLGVDLLRKIEAEA